MSICVDPFRRTAIESIKCDVMKETTTSLEIMNFKPSAIVGTVILFAATHVHLM